MAARKPAPQQQPRTLMEMHDALVRIRPSRDAPLEQWQAYHHRSAALYTEIAEIDRGHHHEALYWAERELQKTLLVTAAIKKGATSWNPWTESAFFPRKKADEMAIETRQAMGCTARATSRTHRSDAGDVADLPLMRKLLAPTSG